MDRELACMLGVTRRLPDVPGATKLANALRRLYLRKRRDVVDAEVIDWRMRLEPSECVDGGLLFYPQLYDRAEIAFLGTVLKPGDVFLDIGANVGFYSLVAGRFVGRAGRVLSIEADPYTYAKLRCNLELNDLTNVEALNVGVADARQTLRLGINSSGNRGGNSFLVEDRLVGVEVECVPLTDILRDHDVTTVRGAKLDIEGFEYRTLRRFFEDAVPHLHPEFLILEANADFAETAGGDAVQLALEHGYKTLFTSELNQVLVRRS